MNRNGKSIFSIVMVAFALLWCLVVLVFVDKTNAAFDYWAGFAFGLVTILATLIVNLVLKFRINRASLEISMIPVVPSMAYLIFGVIFNGAFVLVKVGNHKALIVVINVLALLAFLVVFYFLTVYAARVTDLSEKVGYKAFLITQIKSEMGILLAVCKKGEIRERVMALKTKVDYSDNLAQSVTQNEENLFFNQIKSIEESVQNNVSEEEILKQISEAENTWNIRNAKLTTVR